MKIKNNVVIVTARDGVDLEELSGAMSSISVACGTAGPSIARQIIEGGGVAEVSLSLIRVATDTQSGVEAIFDNFVLSNSRGGRPLVYSLLIDRMSD